MANRYEIFPEWSDDQIKRYRIYDKETDCLLSAYATLQEAAEACAHLAASHTAMASADDLRR